jgi:hypothetical protein
MSFPWEARIPVNPRRGKQTEMKGQGREHNRCPDILDNGGEGRTWRQDTHLRD